MSGFNRIEVIGNVGQDPEMRFTPNGNPVTSFSMAVNEKYKGTERTEWFTVVAWNKLAETCNQYLEKGQQLFVDGRFQTHTWEATDGEKKSRNQIIANKVVFLGQRSRKEESPSEVTPVEEDSLPF